MKVPLHDQRVGVWCAIHGQKIIGAIFLYDTVNAEHNVNGIWEPFFQILTEVGKQCPHFQQGNIVARTSQHSVEALCQNATSSTRFEHAQLYIWGSLKQKVYRNSMHTLETLHTEIKVVIRNVTEVEQQKVS